MNLESNTILLEKVEPAENGVTVANLNASIDNFPAIVTDADVKKEVSRLLREGVTAAKSGDRSAARNSLLHALSFDENNETALMWLASISEQPAELLEFLQKVIAINPENARAVEWEKATKSLLVKSLINKGIAAQQENDLSSATEFFQKAAHIEPENQAAWFGLAKSAAEPEDKLSHLQQLLNLNPTSDEALSQFQATKDQMARILLKKGNLAAVSGDREMARVILRDVMEHNSKIEEAWLLKAYLTDSVEEKTICFRKALEINPHSEQATSNLAALQAMQDEEMAADEELESVQPEIAPEVDINRLEMMVDVVDEQEVEEIKPMVACPFCQSSNNEAAIRCEDCGGYIRLVATEHILNNDLEDETKVRAFIEQTQDTQGLTTMESFHLGLAYLNLRNFKKCAVSMEHALLLNEENAELSEDLKTQISELIQDLAKLTPEHSQTAQQVTSKFIMVVDDSPTVRKLIVGKLEKHGHRVAAAIDGLDALSKISEEIPDLILLDVTMPRLDGYQLCKLVRNNPNTKHVPVVMISGKDGFFDRVRGRMAGSTAYITKPFGPETLMQTVETYCR